VDKSKISQYRELTIEDRFTQFIGLLVSNLNEEKWVEMRDDPGYLEEYAQWAMSELLKLELDIEELH
jgi:hypothetical protein